jgi:hypothetical protein
MDTSLLSDDDTLIQQRRRIQQLDRRAGLWQRFMSFFGRPRRGKQLARALNEYSQQQSSEKTLEGFLAYLAHKKIKPINSKRKTWISELFNERRLLDTLMPDLSITTPEQLSSKTLCEFASNVFPSQSSTTNNNCDSSSFYKTLRQITGTTTDQAMYKKLSEYLLYRNPEKRLLVQGVSTRFDGYDPKYYDIKTPITKDKILKQIKTVKKEGTSDTAIFHGILYGQSVFVKQFLLSSDDKDTLLYEKEVYRYVRSLQQDASNPLSVEYRKHFISLLLCIQDGIYATIITEDSRGITVYDFYQKNGVTEMFVKIMFEMLYLIYLMQQAKILHNDNHIGNILVVSDAQRTKTFTMNQKSYTIHNYPYSLKIYDFDLSCIIDNNISQSPIQSKRIHRVVKCNPQRDVFNWFSMIYAYILGKNIPWFNEKWDKFMETLSDKQGYRQLVQILSNIQNKKTKWYHFCNDLYDNDHIECGLRLDVLSDLGFIVDAFYKAFELA